ncbi:hypothetical protein, partial [Pseudomonas amygdali]|uniref:hypothetical protein n=1 Tax=Pseudomonas amygdali TaxID=47877 RepID=UPI001269D001
PTDEAATKLIWLGLRNITANWGHAAHDWSSASTFSRARCSQDCHLMIGIYCGCFGNLAMDPPWCS